MPITYADGVNWRPARLEDLRPGVKVYGPYLPADIDHGVIVTEPDDQGWVNVEFDRTHRGYDSPGTQYLNAERIVVAVDDPVLAGYSIPVGYPTGDYTLNLDLHFHAADDDRAAERAAALIEGLRLMLANSDTTPDPCVLSTDDGTREVLDY